MNALQIVKGSYLNQHFYWGLAVFLSSAYTSPQCADNGTCMTRKTQQEKKQKEFKFEKKKQGTKVTILQVLLLVKYSVAHLQYVQLTAKWQSTILSWKKQEAKYAAFWRVLVCGWLTLTKLSYWCEGWSAKRDYMVQQVFLSTHAGFSKLFWH